MKYSIKKEVLNISKYIAGKPISEVKREYGLTEIVKLASNENPLGCSKNAKKALSEMINEVGLYPDAAAYELKHEISKKLKRDPEEIFCGAGSDSLIRVICNTVLDENDETIMAEITFPRYETNTKLMGAKAVKIKMTEDLGLDIEAMVNAITDKTKIIWFCNPNNPTGNIFTSKQLEAVIDKIPENVYIVMDEAYYEYVEDKEFPDSLNLLDKYPNMIILRTFSKAYGLASLRIGYGIANKELVDYFNRVINSFDSNAFAQKAATEAIKDDEFLNEVVTLNKEGREYLIREFQKMNLRTIDSQTNFIMVNVSGDDKPIHEYLLRHGYIIRPGFLLGVPGWLRVSIGTKKQNERFIELLKEAISKR